MSSAVVPRRRDVAMFLSQHTKRLTSDPEWGKEELCQRRLYFREGRVTLFPSGRASLRAGRMVRPGQPKCGALGSVGRPRWCTAVPCTRPSRARRVLSGTRECRLQNSTRGDA